MPAQQQLDNTVLQLASRAETDWATMDWINSQAEAVEREALEKNRVRQTAMNALSQTESFLSAVVAGLILGMIGVVADASSHFVSAFRNGICLNYFWLGKELCCAGLEEDCELYYTWGEFFAGRGNRVEGFTNFVFYVALSCAFATVSSFVCKSYSAYASGGGINEVKTIISGHHVKRYLGGWTLVTKTFGMCLSTGSGVVVGKEGPFVHIGACVGDLTAKLFPSYRLEAKKRELISAGAAGGLAVAFGAPVGGVIFALEELSSFYNFKTLMSALICGVTAVLVQSKVDIWHTGRIVQFSVNYAHDWHFFELPVFAALGIFSGLLGSFYNVINIKIIRWRKPRFKNWRVTEVCILGAVTGIVNFATPYGRGSLLEFLGALFQDCTPSSTLEICQSSDMVTMVNLLICGTVKLLLFAYAVGCFLPSGNLVPALAIGAMYGRAFGLFIRALQQSYSSVFIFAECVDQQFCVIPGAYAIVGAGAMLTGVTRMSICLAVIMFELTGSLEYLVPVIIGILFAKWAGEGIGVEGIYEIAIEENKLPFLDPKKEFHHHSVAQDVYKGKEFMVLTARNCTVGGINDLLAKKNVVGFPVLSSLDDKVLLGYVSAKRISQSLQAENMRRHGGVDNTTFLRFSAPSEAEPLSHEEVDLSSLVESSMLQVEPSCPVSRVLYIFKSLGSRHIMVARCSRFEGFISKKDLISFMRTIEHEEHMEEKELIAGSPLKKKGH
jgi:chloride channel 3/4/5